MKFKSRTGKVLGDQNVLTDLGKGTKDALRASPSFFGNFLIGIFNYFIGIGAFISRSFLRKKLGERTFGVITLISVYLLVWFMFMCSNIYNVASMKYADFDNVGSQASKVFRTLSYMVFTVIPDREELEKIIPELSLQTYFFIVVIMIIGLGHFKDLYTRKRNKEIIHSYYRGNSLLFYWLEGESFFGISIKLTAVWMIVEPLFVISISFLVDFLGGNDVATILQISALCLFIEEFRVYQENRRFTLDMIDGQLDAAFAQELQEEYMESLESNIQNENQSSYKASFSNSTIVDLTTEGSNSPFRAKIL